MIDKTYQPAAVEGRIYQAWEAAGAFRAGRPERAGAKPYSIVIPPPNVTGSLHMGHALNNTLQDILARFERMRGRDVLWQPGTDHAGIATQMVVERQLMERQQPGRRAMGREAFVKRVWEWKAESGGAIVNQLKRLGASCDWSRERFTMDEGLSRAVLKVFVELYKEGLIYKDKRLVNWDPKLLTAISDLEVVQVETKGQLWYLRYPLEGKNFDANDPSTYIVVATTRPETMLGDTAVAVNPEDARYKEYVDAFKAGHPTNVILPLVGRRIPIIADEYSDPEKGSGAVKITPAHDFNDFEVGKRHSLQMINVFTPEAKITFEDIAFRRPGGTGADFAETKTLEGKSREDTRKQIVVWLEEKGTVEKIEPNSHVVPHGDRSNVVIEPYLTEQWYVNAKKLAEPAIAAVRNGKTKFVPQNWENTYFNWMENILPWCISRQLWWGHQIPAWYGPRKNPDGSVQFSTKEDAGRIRPEDCEIFVAATEAEAIVAAEKYYGREVIVTKDAADTSWIGTKKDHIFRDEDVLDTWFSSALWPFSTLGWPDQTPELKRFYPTAALVTGFDIIFFWVARMMMMGLHFMKEVPFHDVYIHRLVRDASGVKMSKSKGNVVDPLGVIDQYGADALRFTLARGAAQGHDIRLGPQDVENNRNFATKLWNAARFAEMNECASVAGFEPKAAKQTLNRWIAHETAKATAEVTQAVESYRFNDAAAAAYRFVWNIYCDWYLELVKPVLSGPDGAAKRETQAMVAWARDEILKLLHPFMPFVTEELWTVTSSSVIPGPAEGRNPESRNTTGGAGSLDSGSGATRRPGMTRETLLALAPWPHLEFTDDKAEAEIGWVIDLVTAIRSVRAEMNITAAIPLVLAGASSESKARAERWAEFIKRLARVSEISSAATAPQGSVQLLVRGEVAALPLKGVIDLAAERARLAKEMAKADADIARVDAKLGNANFVARAPEEVVEEEKEKRDEAVARKAKIAELLERLKETDEQPAKRTISVFVLGAGFSRAAGLPLADELWREIRRRAEAMTGRAEKFRKDLNDYIQFVADTEGVRLNPDDVNFEKFLSYLDVEFHLGLRGSDTWSSEGNETQVIVKTLIGQILTERTPKSVPKLYEDFAKKLKPGDTVLTFNYDLLLERALDQIGMPYRLFPDRFKEVYSNGGGTTDLERELSEVLLLKLHGSLDWFSKSSYLRIEEDFRRIGAPGHPHDRIFNPSSGMKVQPLVEGPRPKDDPLKEIYRVADVETLYSDPPLFLQTPLIVAPSTSKILWFDRFKDFWWGMGQLGELNRRMTIIGFSLSAPDDYARQIIYSIIQNYQKVRWGQDELDLGKKTPVLIIDFLADAQKQEEFRKRYSFVDWSRAELHFEGFSADTVKLI